ncbi:MAG TPA: bacillithiol biosynthesis BshC [Gemmatimonadaceae bacterium]
MTPTESDSGPIARTVPLGGGPLAAAVAAGTAPDRWYVPRPRTIEAWRERAEATRGAAGGWLESLEPAIEAEGAASARLRRAANGGVLVTTGQQPGLFGGPMYTWSKALAALALADALEEATGIPTAPLFWAATDDADFEEAAVTHLAVTGGVETLRLAPPPPELAGRPLAELPLGDVEPLLAALERASGSGAVPDVLRLVRERYRSDATIGGAYVGLLRGMLAPLGIAVLDSSHARVRDAAFPTLRAALERAGDLEAAIDRRATELREAGYEPQVGPVPGLTLVFRLDGSKARIRVADADRALAESSPGDLAPNVLLRPVVERAILPTVAYVAGPGELAYFAQVGAVAEVLGRPRPLAVPRWSGMIVEPHIRRLLERRELAPEALADPSAPEREAAARAMPSAARDALAQLRRDIDRAAVTLSGVTTPSGVGAPPPAVVEGARRALAARVERLERRYLAAAKRGEEAALRDLATLRGALRPLGQPQERVLNLLPMIARHGAPLLAAMMAEARRHAIRLLGGTAGSAPERPASAPHAAG